MKYLNDNGWTTLTLDEFYDWQQNGKEIPKKAALSHSMTAIMKCTIKFCLF